ncbi:MAG TPA: hemolysin family protein [Fimbriimonadaceae bacterium]|nr:hemolysin family protein [Fimbriimonadaceae bacterium]
MIEPPERFRSGRWLRRVETGLSLLMASAVTALYLFGAGAPGQTLADAEIGVPGSAAVILILAIIALNGLFVCAESAVDLIRPVHVKHFRDEENPKRADRLQRLLDNKANYTAACILGSHICRVAMVLAGLLLAPGVAKLLNPDGAHGWTTLILASAIVAVPILLLNLVMELVPKSFASLHPMRASLRLYRFVTVWAILLSPPAKLVAAIGNLITARFGGKASFTIENQAEEEIKSLVEDAQESGEIEEGEKEMLHSVFEFTDTVAREVMTPRVDLDAMPTSSDPEQVAKLIEDTGHSRIPLYEETDDQIVGVIHAKDLLHSLRHSNGQAPNLKKLMRPAFFVPETKNLHELLSEMRAHKTQMAIVQDEFGGTAGVVTVEDIVEELVGDIVDEYDVVEQEIVAEGDIYFVDGKTHVDDVNDALGSNLESEEFDTIGGFVFGLFGRQPKLEESIEAECLRFTVIDTDGRRILKLKIEHVDPPQDLRELGDED